MMLTRFASVHRVGELRSKGSRPAREASLRSPSAMTCSISGGGRRSKLPQHRCDVTVVGVQPELVERERRGLASSRIAPPAVLPNLVPSALVTSGTQTMRMAFGPFHPGG